MPGKRIVLIDTDTASDDAVALIMALRSPLIDVAAITVVAGNVPVEQATRNALCTVELCGSEVPVYMGAAKPLTRELEPATWFHGMDGLGDCGYAPAARTAETTHAVDAIIAAAHQHPGLEVITLGPLTDLALALARDPGVVAKISRCVVMGGAPCCEGNVTPAAEFNIWADPEAARAVLLSGLPIELVGCNARAREAYLEQTGEHGISLPDPIAMALLLDPSLALESSDHYVEIETASPLTRGMTVVDRLGVTHDPRNAAIWAQAHAQGRKARVIWKLDIPGWKQLLLRSLA